MIRLVAVLLFAAFLPAARATIWYVDDDAPAGGDGLSWVTAFSQIGQAISASGQGDEIRLGGGTYRVTSIAGVILLNTSIRVGGGFAGLSDLQEPDRRDFVLFRTTLTADFLGNDDGSDDSMSENANLVLQVSGNGSDQPCLISGLTITAATSFGLSVGSWSEIEDCEIRGNRNGLITSSSGNAHPRIRRVTVSHSLSRAGSISGIVMDECVVADNPLGFQGNGPCIASRCRFERNGSISNGNNGGALALLIALINDCEFINNQAMSGAAIYGSATVSRSRFVRNSAQSGGAIAVPSGSGATVSDSVFISNSANGLPAGKGGAISSDSTAGITVRDCLFVSNFSAGDGGAVAARYPAIVTNCTFVDNLAVFFGGAVHMSGTGISSIGNAILWGNAAAFGRQCSVAQGELRIGFSNIQDWPQGIFADSGGRFLLGLGNLGTDPLFVASGTGDFRLAPNSPCIDAGLNAIVLSQSDLAGIARRIDDPDTLDTGLGEPPLVDMGAYEFVPGPLPSDCIGNTDGDTDVDLQDLATLLAHFGQTSGAVVADGDTNGDGGVDLQDLANLLANFGQRCP